MEKPTQILCKKCKTNWHDPKYGQCYQCSGTQAVVCTMGCERHKNNPQPALCLDCMEAKKEYFKHNKAFIKAPKKLEA